MDSESNPFAPGAGLQPPELTGRTGILRQAEIILKRIKEGKTDRSVLLVGLRGVGKTVLLNRIQENAEKVNFPTCYIEATYGKSLAELIVPPMRQMLFRLDRHRGSRERLRKAMAAIQSFASVFKVKIGDIGVGVEPYKGYADGRGQTQLGKYIDAANKAFGDGFKGVIDTYKKP